MMEIDSLAKAGFEEVVKLRRYLHQHPEVTGQELKTAAYVAGYLQSLGIETIIVEDGGVLGIVEGQQPGKTLLLRADMDALPIQENENNLQQKKACCSLMPGVSHACGHDCHTAMLMVEGKILQEHREQWHGRVVLCFERGEEGGGNIKNLLPYLEKQRRFKIDGCYATHVRWDIPAGKAAVLDGAAMAGGFGFKVRLKGQGGHGSRPDLCRNPLDCFVGIYQSMNTMRMLRVPPGEIITFSIGLLEGGCQFNVIPDNLLFGGTSRFYSLERAGRALREGFLECIENNCRLYGCDYELVHWRQPLYQVQNNPDCVELARQAAGKYFAKQVLLEVEPWMASETFALYLQLYPGVQTFTGIANPELGSGANHHTPEFDVDEQGLLTGMTLALGYTLEFLNNSKPVIFSKNNMPAEELAVCNL